ncbi:hypothetical protein QTP88_022421 [Uroleucon formosanum]
MVFQKVSTILTAPEKYRKASIQTAKLAELLSEVSQFSFERRICQLQQIVDLWGKNKDFLIEGIETVEIRCIMDQVVEIECAISADKKTSEIFPTEVVEFWMYIKNVKNFNDCAVFPNLSELALVVLTLPPGNAGVERSSGGSDRYSAGQRLTPLATLGTIAVGKPAVASKTVHSAECHMLSP